MLTKGKVTHFEIPVDKKDRAKKFYAEVFGWQINDVPGATPEMKYTMVGTAESDERGMVTERGAINGGMVDRAPHLQHPVVTIEVDDMDAALARVKKMGGKVTFKKTQMADMGYFAYFEDTEANVLGLWQSTQRM
jgi:uncharacterized protein